MSDRYREQRIREDARHDATRPVNNSNLFEAIGLTGSYDPPSDPEERAIYDATYERASKG